MLSWEGVCLALLPELTVCPQGWRAGPGLLSFPKRWNKYSLHASIRRGWLGRGLLLSPCYEEAELQSDLQPGQGEGRSPGGGWGCVQQDAHCFTAGCGDAAEPRVRGKQKCWALTSCFDIASAPEGDGSP